MVVTYDDSKIGKLVHRSTHHFEFKPGMMLLDEPVVDGNSHYNSAVYTALTEKVRIRLFLPEYGFSDEKFNEMGCRMVRTLEVVDWKGGPGITGNEVDVKLDLYVERAYFHLYHEIMNLDGSLAAKAVGNQIFLRKTKSGGFIPLLRVPEFFVDAIRNVKS